MQSNLNSIIMHRGNHRYNSVIPHDNISFSPVNERMSAEVTKIISFIADKHCIPALINLLDDNESDVRWIASESLIRIGKKSIVPLLKSLRDGKRFLYPVRVHHVLQSLLTMNEKKELQDLLKNLADSPEKPEIAIIEASVALKHTFRCDN
jgi:hypothetical protein